MQCVGSLPLNASKIWQCVLHTGFSSFRSGGCHGQGAKTEEQNTGEDPRSKGRSTNPSFGHGRQGLSGPRNQGKFLVIGKI